MPRPRNVDVRREILRLWSRGVRRPSEIARRLGLPVARVKYYMHAMRREKLLPSAEPHGDLLEEALTELKAASVKATWILQTLEDRGMRKEAKVAGELRGHVERAAELVRSYKAVKKLEKP